MAITLGLGIGLASLRVYTCVSVQIYFQKNTKLTEVIEITKLN
jgi:hypothetical protein